MLKISLYAILFLQTAIITGCASDNPSFVYDVNYEDRPSENRFVVSVVNLGDAGCFFPTSWPDSKGVVDVDDHSGIIALIGDRWFRYRGENAGYCPECATVLPESSTIEGFLPYDRFGIPEALREDRKELIFDPKLRSCS